MLVVLSQNIGVTGSASGVDFMVTVTVVAGCPLRYWSWVHRIIGVEASICAWQATLPHPSARSTASLLYRLAVL